MGSFLSSVTITQKERNRFDQHQYGAGADPAAWIECQLW
jgi:hypothetical protein